MSDKTIYETLGIKHVINARGNQTLLGGSLLPKKVQIDMEEASLHFVEMQELLNKSGDYIANILGTESAYVTSGCAAAITLSTAACMAGTNEKKIGKLPDTSSMKNEILIQKLQRYRFDRCFTLAGGKLVEFGNQSKTTKEDLENSIGNKTAAIAYVLNTDITGNMLSLNDTVEIGRKHKIPVITDAASQIYPLDYFKSSAQLPDLACFGAKYFGAPHSSGIVAGKKHLVEAVKSQGFIAYHHDGGLAYGRAMKLDRQEIAGVVSALTAWFSINHEDRLLNYDKKIETIQSYLKGINGVKSEVLPVKRFYGSTLKIQIDPKIIGKTAKKIAEELDSGNPRIWVYAESDPKNLSIDAKNLLSDSETIAVNVHTLNEYEEKIIGERLKYLLT